MKKITIEFKTLDVPAPFAHDYELKLVIDKNIDASYYINYKGREDLTEEEILEEGYTIDDDFEWAGKIDTSWKNQLLSLIDTKPQGKDVVPNEFTQTEFTISVNSDGKISKSVHYDDENLSYQVQEIVQALFETSKREFPLQINFLLKERGKKEEFKVVLSFASRSCEISQKGKIHKKLSWEDGSSFMSLVYQPDYLLDLAKTKKDDLYISFEDNAWFSVADIEENERLSGFKKALLKFLI